MGTSGNRGGGSSGRKGHGRSPARATSPRNSLGRDLPDLQKARACWLNHQFDEALRLFAKTAKKHPRNALALVDAARAFGARFEIAEAERMLEHLLRLGAGRPDLLQLAGQSYRMIFRPDRAITCLEKALEIDPDAPDAHLELAVLYERGHGLEAAQRHIEACLRLVPDYLEAKLIQARILRRQGAEAEAGGLLRALSIQDGAHPQIRAQAEAELAQILDRQGGYAEAWQAMTRCKALLRAEAEPVLRESKAAGRRLRQLTGHLTAADIRRWQRESADVPPQPIALLTGPPRSGTTLLEKILDGHPGVVSSDEREVFPKYIFPAMVLDESRKQAVASLNDIPPERLAVERKRYVTYMTNLLAEPTAGRLLLDKNPSMIPLILPLLRLFPECRILLAIRDPRDVVLSCFMCYLPLNGVSVHYLDIEQAADQYLEGMQAWLRLREQLPVPWQEIRYENTVHDLGAEALKAIEFLGLDWDDEVLAYRDHLQRRPTQSPTYEAVSRPLYTTSIGRWKNYLPFVEPVLDRLQPLVGEFGYD